MLMKRFMFSLPSAASGMTIAQYFHPAFTTRGLHSSIAHFESSG